MAHTYKKKNYKDNPEPAQKTKSKTTPSAKTQLLGQAYIGLGPEAK